MHDYAGRVLADRYRLPRPPSDAYDFVETRAFDTYSGQEVMVRQLPLPEVVDAEVAGADGRYGAPGGAAAAARRASDPGVRRAIDAVLAAAGIPDHPRLDQVFDVFAEGGSLWIVSELVVARPLSAYLAERPMSPHRAAEVAADILTALRAVHAHGWTHRNITARTVLVCDDGRAMLTGLAAGAAEEALCGYDPVPRDPGSERDAGSDPGGGARPRGAEGRAAGEQGASARSMAGHRPVAVPPGPAAHQGAPPAVSPGAAEIGPRRPKAGAGTASPRVPALGSPAAGHSWAPSPAPGASPEPHGPAAQPPSPAGPEPGVPAPGGRAAEDGHGDVVVPDPRAARTGAVAANLARARTAAARTRVGPEAPADPGSEPGGHAAAHPAGPGALPAPRSAPRAGADAPAARSTATRAPAHTAPGDRWDAPAAAAEPTTGTHRGPLTPLAAERARQARMLVVGAVTERWAPEQARPLDDEGQPIAGAVGPATDLWALGALLFRAVQGHAPFPEESAAELVRLVCSEPPAYAEDCGPLRPVVESLLRQDPAERPDVEELSGWLRSLIRSAPEPDIGSRTVLVPSIGSGAPAPALGPGTGTPGRLPVVRRRGELVRRRRVASPAVVHGRHKKAKGPRPRSPRSLGLLLVGLILLALIGALTYAALVLPPAGQRQDGGGRDRTGAAGAASEAPAQGEPTPSQDQDTQTPVSQQPQTTAPADLPPGFALRTDPRGFEVAVHKGWQRRGENDRGQIRYLGGDYELIVVPGRDSVDTYGSDPMAYQQDKERELASFRSSQWSSASGLRRIDVGQTAMAEGAYTWKDSSGREVYARNLAMILDRRYHLVLVIGPAGKRDEVDHIFEQAADTYRVR